MAPAFTVGYSATADRGRAAPLDGATVAGNIYTFTTPATGLYSVNFYLDDPTRAGAIFRSEASGHVRLRDSGSTAAALPYDTNQLTDGTHTIAQAVLNSAKKTVVFTATFTVLHRRRRRQPRGGSGNGQIALQWDPKSGSTVGFNIYRSTTPTINTDRPTLNGANLVTGSTFTDTTASNGRTYYYEVQSVDSAGRTSFSPVVSSFASAGGTQTLQAPSLVALSGYPGTAGAAQGVTLQNLGSSPLSVSGLTLGGTNANQFQLVSAPALPLTIRGRGQATINVALNPTIAGISAGTLTIASNDAAHPTVVVTLRGLAVANANAEPSLQQIFDTWQIPDSTGDPSPADIFLPVTSPLGDEVTAQDFVKAGPGPVSITPLANYTGNASTPTAALGWVPEGAGLSAVHAAVDPGHADADAAGQSDRGQRLRPGQRGLRLHRLVRGQQAPRLPRRFAERQQRRAHPRGARLPDAQR